MDRTVFLGPGSNHWFMYNIFHSLTLSIAEAWILRLLVTKSNIIQENVDVNIDAEFVVKCDVVVDNVSYILLDFLDAIHANTQFSACNICKHSYLSLHASTCIFLCNICICKHFYLPAQYLQALVSFCYMQTHCAIFASTLCNICKHQAITLCLLRTTPLATTSPAQMTKHNVHNVEGA